MGTEYQSEGIWKIDQEIKSERKLRSDLIKELLIADCAPSLFEMNDWFEIFWIEQNWHKFNVELFYCEEKNRPSVCNKQIASTMAFKPETFSCGSIAYWD